MSHSRNLPSRPANEERSPAQRAWTMVRPLQDHFEDVLGMPTRNIASLIEEHNRDQEGTEETKPLTYFDDDGLYDVMRRSFQDILQFSRDDLSRVWDPLEADSEETASEPIRNLASFIERLQDYCRFAPIVPEMNTEHSDSPSSHMDSPGDNFVAEHFSETNSEHSDIYLSHIDSPGDEFVDAHEDQPVHEDEAGPSMHRLDDQDQEDAEVDPDSLAYPLYEVYGHFRTPRLTRMRGKVDNWAWELEGRSFLIKDFATSMLNINNDVLRKRINTNLDRELESLADIDEALASEWQAHRHFFWPPRDPNYDVNDIDNTAEDRRIEAEWAYWYIFNLLSDVEKCFFQLRDYFEVFGEIHGILESMSDPVDPVDP